MTIVSLGLPFGDNLLIEFEQWAILVGREWAFLSTCFSINLKESNDRDKNKEVCVKFLRE